MNVRMNTHIRSEPLRYTVWTSITLDQIPIGLGVTVLASSRDEAGLDAVLQSNVDPRDDVFSYRQQCGDKPSLNKAEDRKEYNIGVLRHLQVIFGHLAASRLQYYVPRGFWKQFRYARLTSLKRIVFYTV